MLKLEVDLQKLFDILARDVFPFLITTPGRARLWLELIVMEDPRAGYA